MLRFVFIILLCLPQLSVARDFNYIIYNKSFHEGNNDYQENNQGFGIEDEINSKRVIALGYFVNSFNDPTVYIGYYLKCRWSNSLGDLDLGFVNWLLWARSYNKGNLMPVSLPYIAVSSGPFGLNILIKPKLFKDDEAVIGLQFKIRL